MLRWRKRAVFAIAATLLLSCVWAFFPTQKMPAAFPLSDAQDTLPSELSNLEFRTMIEDFSEPNGYFRSDNLLSNEADLQRIIPTLKQIVGTGGVYMGVGPEQNFTYILNLEPRISFIVDIRRMNMLEHLLYKALFELSMDRAEFVSRLFSRERPKHLASDASVENIFDAYERIPGNEKLFEQNLAAVLNHLLQTRQIPLTTGDQEQIRYVYNAFFRSGPALSYTFNDSNYQGSLWGMPTYKELMLDTTNGRPRVNVGFLSNEERFHRVRNIQEKNLIVPLVGDFAGPKTIRAIGKYMREHNAALSTFYTSNVEMYLFQDEGKWRAFYANVATLPTNPSSTFVRFAIRYGRSQMWSPVESILAGVRDRKVTSYDAVLEMSH
jgi:hypothetical protein